MEPPNSLTTTLSEPRPQGSQLCDLLHAHRCLDADKFKIVADKLVTVSAVHLQAGLNQHLNAVWCCKGE